MEPDVSGSWKTTRSLQRDHLLSGPMSSFPKKHPRRIPIDSHPFGGGTGAQPMQIRKSPDRTTSNGTCRGRPAPHLGLSYLGSASFHQECLFLLLHWFRGVELVGWPAIDLAGFSVFAQSYLATKSAPGTLKKCLPVFLPVWAKGHPFSSRGEKGGRRKKKRIAQSRAWSEKTTSSWPSYLLLVACKGQVSARVASHRTRRRRGGPFCDNTHMSCIAFFMIQVPPK